MKIEVSEQAAEAITLLWDRYYFGLFQEVTQNEEEEYQMRNAIKELADKIEKSDKIHRG